LCNIETS